MHQDLKADGGRSKMTETPTNPAPQLLASTPSRLQTAIILVAAFLAALAAGWPTLRCGFTSGDDQRFITDHYLVAHSSPDNALKLITIIHGDLYQPLPMLTFHANYALAENQPKDRFGISPLGFHLTNIILHAFNAILVTLFALRISRREAIALLAGLLFACHPFAVESVAWVSGRMMLLATTFALITILLCTSKQPHNPLLAAAAWFLSLTSKVLPTIPLAAAWLDYKQHGKLDRRSTRSYALLLVMAAAAAIFAIYTTQQAGFVTDDAEFQNSPVVRILLASRYYIENYIVPTRLSPWVPPPNGVSLSSPECIVATIEILALAALAFAFRKRLPLVHIGIMTFAIILLPFLATSTARRFLAADRYMYLPIAGLHLAVAAMLVALSDWLDARLKPSFRHRFLFLPSAAILVPCLLLSWNYSLTWIDTVSRDHRAVAVYPDNPLTHYELAKAYNFSDRPYDALNVIAKARESWPDHPRLIAQAGESHRALQDWPAAEHELRAAAEKMPGHASTHYQLALVLEKLDRPKDAIQTLESLIVKSPGYLPAWTALGRLRRAANEESAAIDAYNHALKINPNHRGALMALAELRMSNKDWLGAILLLRKIVANDPKDAQSEFQLAVALVQVGQTSEAFDIYTRLIARDEENVTLRFNRAAVAEHLGNVTIAEQDYLFVATERPELLEPYIALHEILAAQRRFDRTLEIWQFRSEKLPEQYETQAPLVWAYVLAGQGGMAAQIAEQIGSSTPVYGMIQLALIYDDLIQEKNAEMRDLLDKVWLYSIIGRDDDWRTRIIQSSISGLPESIKKSRAGRFFLAHYLLLRLKDDFAIFALEQIVAENPRDEWGISATRRIEEIRRLKLME